MSRDIRDMDVLETILDIPNRIITLVWKLISVKGAALGCTVMFILRGTLGGWEAVTLFVFVTLMVIGGREAEKWQRYFSALKK